MFISNKKIHALFLLIIFFYCYSVSAQRRNVSEISLNANKDYLVEFWDTKDGLEQNFVEGFYQTNDGYLWIMTRGGLSRFDGLEPITIYRSKNITDYFIKALVEEESNDAWLINADFRLHKLPKGKKELLQINTIDSVISVCSFDKQNLVYARFSGEMGLLNKSNGSIKVLKDLRRQVLSILNLNNEIFIATTSGLFKWQNNVLTQIPELKNGFVQAIVKSNSGVIAGICNKRFFKIADSGFEWLSDLDNLPGLENTQNFLMENEGRIWIPTLKGLASYDGKHLNVFTEEDGLTSNQINSVFKNKEGDVFIGTCNMGLNKLKLKKMRVYGKQNGMVENVCRPIIQINDGKVLIGHWNDITEWDGENFKPYLRHLPGSIWTMMQDKNGQLWIGTKDSGIIVFKDKRRMKLNIGDSVKLWGVKVIYEDRHGVVWVASRNDLYSYSNKVFKKVLSTKGAFWITSITEDTQGKMWICSSAGLFLLQNGELKAFGTAEGISDNVRCIHQDKEGVYWLATYGHGIYRYKNGVFFYFKDVADSYSSWIMEDKSGKFWISTNTGVYSVKKSDLNDYADKKTPFISDKYHAYHDGIKNPECNGGFQNCALYLNEDKICFPSENGLIVVDTKVERESGIPNLVIEEIVKDGVAVAVSDSSQFIGEILESIKVKFTAPHFDELNNVWFQCMLEGKDSNWSERDYERELNYSKLPPGNYTLKIRVYGSLNEKWIGFRVPSPFWQTGGFYLMMGICILFISVLIIYWRIRHIKKTEQEKLERGREYAALELKALQGQMNPHFMFNCLNTIKYFVATDNKEAASKYLSKFSALIRLFLDQSNSNQVDVEEEIKLITLYVEMEQLRLDNTFDLELSVDEEVRQQGYKIPTIILQPFVENAIHHGLLGLTSRKGLLKVSFTIEENQIKIVIDDNGVGRKKSMERKNMKLESHKSLGIRNVFERLNSINYIRATYVSLAIEDKPENAAGETGTRVIVKVPLDYNLSSINSE